MSSANRTPLKISIEGNIATGKSTFIDLLQLFNPDSWHVVPEPVAEWTKVPDSEKIIESSPKPITDSPRKRAANLESPIKSSPIRNRPTPKKKENDDEEDEEEVDPDAPVACSSAANLLECFYSDTPRWAYTFQSYALLSRMRLQRRPMPKRLRKVQDPVLFYERSLYTDRYIFAKNCAETGLMVPMEWDIYSDWSDYLLDTVGEVHIHGVIYLRCTPDTSYQRLGKRGRPEENGVTLDYLTQLHTKHEAWLHDKNVEKHPSLSDVPILELDCNKEFETDPAYRTELFHKVKTFLEACRTDQLQKRIQKMNANKENKPAPAKKMKTSPENNMVTGKGSMGSPHAKRALDLSEGDNTLKPKTK
jgi:deoxycitidine kinase